MSATVTTRAKRRVLMPIEENKISEIREKRRIPISKIYWEKGTYRELVDDPFNLKK
jgi:hypothetical protein